MNKNNSTPFSLSYILKKHLIKPEHRLGQVFLADNVYLKKVITHAQLENVEEVLEIGAGVGNLTRLIAEKVKRVVAVEIDGRLLPALKETLCALNNVEIILGDILSLDVAEIMNSDGYQVVANIPYYITTAIVRHLLEASKKPSRIVLTIQKEVAQRICDKEGEYSILSLSVQVYGKPQMATIIPAGAFYPPPKVDSAVLIIELYPEPLIPYPLLNNFFGLIKIAFSQKRKMIKNSFSAGLGWKSSQVQELFTLAQIDDKRRPETLTFEEWRHLVNVYQQKKVEYYGII